MSQVLKAFGRIKLLRPKVLRAALSEQEIEAQVKCLPFQLPDDLRAFYQLSDGLGEVCQFSILFAIPRLSRAISLYNRYCKRSKHYCQDWFPVVEEEGFIWVTPCTQGTRQTSRLIALGDDLVAMQWNYPPEFQVFEDVLMSAIDQFERDDAYAKSEAQDG